MKRNFFLVMFSITSVFMSSCTRTLYQTFDVKSKTVSLDSTKNAFIYEDSTVRINYNMWGKYGVLNFSIYNKSNRPIYLDWNKSNFIRNSYSFDYYQATEKLDVMSSYQLNTTRHYTLTGQTSWRNNSDGYNSNTNVNLNGNTESVLFGNSTYLLQKEKPVNQLPPSSFITISTFYIGRDFYNEVDSIPSDSSVTTMTFQKDKTPITFRNYIAYSFDQHLDSMKFIDNEFWVDKVNTYGHYLFSQRKNSIARANRFWADALVEMEAPQKKVVPQKVYKSFIYLSGMWSLLSTEQIPRNDGDKLPFKFFGALDIGLAPWVTLSTRYINHSFKVNSYGVEKICSYSFLGEGFNITTGMERKSKLQFYFGGEIGYKKYYYDRKINGVSTGGWTKDKKGVSGIGEIGFRIFPIPFLGFNSSIEYGSFGAFNFGLTFKI